MIFTETALKGAYIIDIQPLEDERGFFARGYCQKEFESYGLSQQVVQTNFSFNKHAGTLRGMHLQSAPFEETKLVRCTRGAIYDVIIDMRVDSDTYKQWIGVELKATDYRMLYVPGGFAHGFITLEDQSDVCYQVSQFYTPGYEKGYRWDDPAFGIDWPIEPGIVSLKDLAHPLLETANPL